MSKNRFTSNAKKRIALSDGDWVDIKEGLSFEEFRKIFTLYNPTDQSKNMEIAIPMLKMTLLDWSFMDPNNVKMPCTPENIEKLNVETVMEILQPVISNYLPEKKN